MFEGGWLPRACSREIHMTSSQGIQVTQSNYLYQKLLILKCSLSAIVMDPQAPGHQAHGPTSHSASELWYFETAAKIRA